jgi:hypothetical protein
MSYDTTDRILIALRMFRMYRRNGFTLSNAARSAWRMSK